MHVESFEVDAPNVVYSDQFIESTYEYQTTKVEKRGNKAVVRPVTHTYKFRTERNVPKLGMMLVRALQSPRGGELLPAGCPLRD